MKDIEKISGDWANIKFIIQFYSIVALNNFK